VDFAYHPEDLLEQPTNEVNTKALISLTKALARKANRSQLKEIYRRLNRDLNAGTLFLLVHPTQQDAEYRFHHIQRFWPKYYVGESMADGARPGVLWTGDAPSSVLNRLLQDGTTRLHKLLGGVLFHQVAHHGSISSLSLPWVKHVGSRWRQPWGFPTSVVSSGRSNNYGHPSPRVLWEYGAEVVYEGSKVFEGSFEWR
jgi:hypothetical protein